MRFAADLFFYLTGNFSAGQRQIGCSCETKKIITPALYPFGFGGVIESARPAAAGPLFYIAIEK